jgi:hypothetical protein
MNHRLYRHTPTANQVFSDFPRTQSRKTAWVPRVLTLHVMLDVNDNCGLNTNSSTDNYQQLELTVTASTQLLL